MPAAGIGDPRGGRVQDTAVEHNVGQADGDLQVESGLGGVAHAGRNKHGG
jgi:hypothetical protein